MKNEVGFDDEYHKRMFGMKNGGESGRREVKWHGNKLSLWR